MKTMTDHASRKFVREVETLAAKWEKLGWLHKFHDADGLEYWELTPLGRRKLDLPPLKTQQQ
jgi:hypothetical protein